MWPHLRLRAKFLRRFFTPSFLSSGERLRCGSRSTTSTVLTRRSWRSFTGPRRRNTINLLLVYPPGNKRHVWHLVTCDNVTRETFVTREKLVTRETLVTRMTPVTRVTRALMLILPGGWLSTGARWWGLRSVSRWRCWTPPPPSQTTSPASGLSTTPCHSTWPPPPGCSTHRGWRGRYQAAHLQIAIHKMHKRPQKIHFSFLMLKILWKSKTTIFNLGTFNYCNERIQLE